MLYGTVDFKKGNLSKVYPTYLVSPWRNWALPEWVGCVRGIQYKGDSLLVFLKMDGWGPPGQKFGEASGRWECPLTNSAQRSQSYNHKELNVANNLNELISWSFPRTTGWESRLADSLISTPEDSGQRIQLRHTQTSELQNLWYD